MSYSSSRTAPSGRADFNTSSVMFSSPLTTPSKYQQAQQKKSSVEHSIYLSPETEKISPNAPIYNNASATNIIKAFRELQSKQKDVEQERLLAIKQRDDLRHKLSDLRRGQALWRSKAEIEATENFLTIRTANDRLKYEYGDIEAKLSAQESKFNAIERHRIALRSLQGTLQDDVSQNDARISTMEHQNAVLRAELHTIESRISNLNRAAIRSPEAHRKHSNNMLRSVESLEHEIEKVRLAKMRTVAKTKALQSYMDLILKINGDLSDTLVSREQIKAEIMRLNSRIVPPHYTWPKEVRSPSIERRMRSNSDAATAVVQAAIDSAAALNNQFLNHSISNLSRSSFRRSKSANRSRISAASSKSIARQGAVNYATRFAAAATAAATAARVHNTPSPVKTARTTSPSATARSGDALNTTVGTSGIDGATHADRQEPRACFIPPGNQSSEFNVVASVSKAARAARELNATIASK
jgi:predicted  nucleic acid-binding Zn-ribbon protein